MTAAGPDVTVGILQEAGNFGSAGGYYAYSVGTTSCNVGDANLAWVATTAQHPVIAQNLYRLHNGRFEQIGMSWLKHAFVAVSGAACSLGCVPSGSGSALGVQCSDPYSADLNGAQNLGPRSEVNATTGVFPFPYLLDPMVTDVTSRRIRVAEADLNPALNFGAQYFLEAQYIAPDDAAAGNHHNNVSHRPTQVDPISYDLSFAGPTVQESAAIEAWAALDPNVQLVDAYVDGGRFILAYNVVDLGTGFWEYEYALYNMNSDRSAASFSVPLGTGVVAQSIDFHDVDYHSGEPYSGADWTPTQGANDLTWATTPFATDPNANALRWGTLYNFRFVANSPPQLALVSVELFKPGTPTSIAISTMAPIGAVGSTPPVTNLACSTSQLDAHLSWANGTAYDSVLVFRDSQQVATLPGTATSYTDPLVAVGIHDYIVNGVSMSVGSVGATCSVDILPPAPLTGLSCSPVGHQVELDWTNGDIYDSIAVHRNGHPLTVLPGTDTQFIDVGVNTGSYTYELTPRIGSVDSTTASCQAQIAAPASLSFEFSAPPSVAGYDLVTGAGSFSQSLFLTEDGANPDFPNDVLGFGVAVAHDDSLLVATGVDPSAIITQLNGGMGPDFEAYHIYPDGITAGVVFSWQLDASIQASAATELLVVHYDTVAAALAGDADGETTSLAWTDGVLGAPPVLNNVVVGITNHSPTFVDGTVTLAPATSGGFVRSDANGDGSINVADAVYVLAYLFNSGSGDCLKAMDHNDDGAANIADPVGMLSFLFTMGAAPTAPYPNCGADPTPDALPCAFVPLCP